MKSIKSGDFMKDKKQIGISILIMLGSVSYTHLDLNWQNEEVRNELIKVINFWLQKGIRGFRFDVINNIDKRSFEDSPDGLGKQFYCCLLYTSRCV